MRAVKVEIQENMLNTKYRKSELGPERGSSDRVIGVEMACEALQGHRA